MSTATTTPPAPLSDKPAGSKRPETAHGSPPHLARVYQAP